MEKEKKFILALAGFLIFGFHVSAAEEIKGKACYRYSDRESIQVGRDIAMAMAKRDALEGFAVFVESTSTVDNFTLRNDLITGITSGLLQNIKVIEKTENRQENTICISISANIEPAKVKEQIVQRKLVFQERFEAQRLPTGLYENNIYKVIKSQIIDCPIREQWFPFDIGYVKAVKCYRWRIYCKEKGGTTLPIYEYHWVDRDGIPLGRTIDKRGIFCRRVGQIKETYVPIPPKTPRDGIRYSLKITK